MTIEEWWEYTRRRGWIASEDPGLYRLTKTAREELQARRKRESAPNLQVWGSTIATWTLSVGVTGGVALLTTKYLAAWLAIVLGGLTIAVMLVIVAPLLRAADAPTDRWFARRACDWLDGAHVAWSVPARPELEGPVQRLYECALPGAETRALQAVAREYN